MKIDSYSAPEEVINCLTHCLGIYLSLILAAILCYAGYLSGMSTAKLMSLVVYGLGTTLMFTMSSAYHCVRYRPAKRVLKKLDHISIYIAICGFYTPCCVFLIIPGNRVLGLSVLAAEYGLMLAGIVFKLFTAGRFKGVSTSAYLLMGWLGVVGLGEIIKAATPEMLGSLLLCGAAYTVGCVFYLVKSVKYFHCVWHTFVLLGAMFNFYFMFKLA